MDGTLYGLGIGPGDPELITVKALRLLTSAAVVAYPAPENGDSLARSIVASYLSGEQTEIAIRMPMVQSRFPAKEVYDWAAAQIGEHLESGHDVAVLCEGDPFFYGSFTYLFSRMVERFRVEVVPGVSSLTACAAVSGMPLATRNDVLNVIPATLGANELERRLSQGESAAIIKVGRHLEKVRGVLDQLGLADNARYVEHATMHTERIVSLSEVSQDSAPYFSMILVHCRGIAWK